MKKGNLAVPLLFCTICHCVVRQVYTIRQAQSGRAGLTLELLPVRERGLTLLLCRPQWKTARHLAIWAACVVMPW